MYPHALQPSTSWLEVAGAGTFRRMADTSRRCVLISFVRASWRWDTLASFSSVRARRCSISSIVRVMTSNCKAGVRNGWVRQQYGSTGAKQTSMNRQPRTHTTHTQHTPHSHRNCHDTPLGLPRGSDTQHHTLLQVPCYLCHNVRHGSRQCGWDAAHVQPRGAGKLRNHRHTRSLTRVRTTTTTTATGTATATATATGGGPRVVHTGTVFHHSDGRAIGRHGRVHARRHGRHHVRVGGGGVTCTCTCTCTSTRCWRCAREVGWLWQAAHRARLGVLIATLFVAIGMRFGRETGTGKKAHPTPHTPHPTPTPDSNTTREPHAGTRARESS